MGSKVLSHVSTWQLWFNLMHTLHIRMTKVTSAWGTSHGCNKRRWIFCDSELADKKEPESQFPASRKKRVQWCPMREGLRASLAPLREECSDINQHTIVYRVFSQEKSRASVPLTHQSGPAAENACVKSPLSLFFFMLSFLGSFAILWAV